MLFEKMKQLSAVLGIASVAITMHSTIKELSLKSDHLSFAYTRSMIISVTVAAMAAVIHLTFSRLLEQERKHGRIFVIHAHEDTDSAEKLASELRSQGFNIWLDTCELTPGQIWKKEALQALERSAVALVLVSSNLPKSGFVYDEIQTALDTLQERASDLSTVIPVRLDGTSPPKNLSHIQWVNLFDEGGMKGLVDSLGRMLRST